MDTRIGNKIGLELVEVHVESSVEPEASRDRRDDLCNEPVEVGVGRALYPEVVLAEIVNGLIVHQEGHVSVLQCGVGEQDGVVGLDYCGGDLTSENLSAGSTGLRYLTCGAG